VEGDLLAGEVFELADQVALPALFVEPGLVIPGAEVVVVGVGVGQDVVALGNWVSPRLPASTR
jgi:hypothetical protein